MRKYKWGLGLLRATVVVLLLLHGGGVIGQEEEEAIILTSTTDYPKVAGKVNGAEISRTISTLAGFGSRVTGYPGCDRAAQWMESRFKQLGLANVRVEQFPVAVPMVERDAQGRAASLTVARATDLTSGKPMPAQGRSFEVQPLWPNLVRTSQTPPEGLTGRLIYAGKGDVRAFNGKDVIGSIVLLDFNCGAGWFSAPLMGAKAVLFIEPDKTIRGEAEQKFLSMPVNMPRFWVPRATADYLLGLLDETENLQVTMQCRMKWQDVIGKNITGVIRGSDPRLSKQQVVIQAYYDSISIAPGLAPGAENACSIAALLETIKAFQAQRPKRTVLFLASSAHFEGMTGEKSFIKDRIRGARADVTVKKMFQLADEARARLEVTTDQIWGQDVRRQQEQTAPEQRLADQLRGLSRLGGVLRQVTKRVDRLERVIQRAPDNPNQGKLPEQKLTPTEMARREQLLKQFQSALGGMRAAVTETQQLLTQLKQVQAQDASAQQQFVDQAHAAVERLTSTLDFSDQDIFLWFSVDLSSHNDTFGIFWKAYFYNCNESIQWKFSDVGKKAREYGDLAARALGVSRESRMVDGINSIAGKSWSAYMAGKLGLGNEVAVLAGIPGLGFATTDDTRPWIDTPLDTPDRVESGRVTTQAKFLACVLCDLVSTDDPKNLYNIDLTDNFTEVKARLVQNNPEENSFVPEPIPDAIAVARTGMKTAMGIRGEIIDIAAPYSPGYAQRLAQRRLHPPQTLNERLTVALDMAKESETAGRVDLIGLPNINAVGGWAYVPPKVPVEGYLLNGESGEVTMAPDRGSNGADAYPIDVVFDQQIKSVTVVMFACKPMAIYDMVDQRFFELLSELYVYDAARDAVPYQFGYCLPVKSVELVSTYEPVALVFAPSGMKVKVTMGATLLGLRFLLVNPTPTEPLGQGYLIDDFPNMYATPYRVASDMWRLDDGPQRLQALVKHGIRNDRVMLSHSRAQEELQTADRALINRQYDQFLSASRAAWGFESRAYPEIRTTLDDVIKGILFYLALLLPFSFFTERLLIASPFLKWQITGVLGIFIVIFCMIGLVHPAFAITFTPAIILLAFIILALTCLVIGIIVQKFEEQMKEVRYTHSGMHTADVGRLGATGAAFSLGVSNMRRRKTRTLLTCLTLILLTFTVLSFTSVVQTIRRNRVLLPRIAPYNGVMIRDMTWSPIGESTYRIMENEFAGLGYPVAARAWYFSAKSGQQSTVTVRRGAASYAATAMAGFMPSEAQITHPQQYILPGGRWFRPEDGQACLIPEGMAVALGITQDQVGTATVDVFGTRMPVLGILRTSQFQDATDLDGEPLTPVDFVLMATLLGPDSGGGGSAGKKEQMREYTHLAPDNVIVVPYDFATGVGATVRSVAIGMPNAEHVELHARDLMERVELNIYSGEGGHTYLVSAVGSTSLAGASDLIIPILIAAAIVLNTMLGSVYERVREIHIYSSLGLAPTHVAALFIAEACVYAVLGAVAGYLVGQLAVKGLEHFHMLTGLNLNYSSLSAVGATSIIMLTVLLSVIYPARKASDIAMPGIERRWSLPEPTEDMIAMTLPFTVTGDQALGVNMYLQEFLSAHADYSLGQFSTANISLARSTTEEGEGYDLGAMVWLAPFDLGVSEQVVIETRPTEDAEVYRIGCSIRRVSGDNSSWMRVTRNYINILRRQFLLWRTFPAAQKDDYGRRAAEMLGSSKEV